MKAAALALLACAACAGLRAPAAARLAEPRVLCEDAGWCWFQDERAVALDERRIVFGSVANGRGVPERQGDVQATEWDTVTGQCVTVELQDRLERDDHDAPAFLVQPDGRLLAAWCGHGKDRVLRTRISAAPGDATAWSPMVESDMALGSGHGITYANLHRLDGALVCLSRAEGWNPTVFVAEDDQGTSWRNAGRLLAGPGRPYANYTSRAGRLHFVVTEQHPRDFDNGLYHAQTDATGDICATTGEALGAWGTLAPQQCTAIFRGAPDAVAWPCDLELDARGQPVAVFSVQVDGRGEPRGAGGLDHRFWYARFDGERWQAHEMAFAGTRLYAGEDDYTGLCCLCPQDPSVVFVSTDADPQTGAPLVSAEDGRRHRELFMGKTRDGGQTFAWTAITRDSPADNLRPIAPRWHPGRCALLWLRGEYRSYTDYDTEAVGLVLELPR